MKKTNKSILTILFVVFAGYGAFAQSGATINVLYGSSPVIDGTLSPDEWDDAVSFTFTGYNSITITCHIKHNGTDTLYIAQDVPEMLGGDHGYIWLDVYNDGGSAPQTDDFWLSSYYFDGWPTIETTGTGSAWSNWTDPSAWICAHTGEGWSYDWGQMEFAIAYSKMGIISGTPKTIGFMIGFGDDPGETDCWFWPQNGWYLTPDSWANMVSSDNWGNGGVGTAENQFIIPDNFHLINYPNPFCYSTVIGYQLYESSKTTLKIYNLSGQETRTLVNTNQQEGKHSVIWDGTDNLGKPVGSGIYFCKLNIDNKPVSTIKIMYNF